MRLEDALKIQNEHIGALGKAMRRLESELQQAATNKHQDAQPSEKVHNQALMNRDVRYADLQRQMNALKDENLVAGFRSRRIEDVPDEPPGRSAQRAPDSVLFPGQTIMLWSMVGWALIDGKRLSFQWKGSEVLCRTGNGSWSSSTEKWSLGLRRQHYRHRQKMRQMVSSHRYIVGLE